MRDSYVFSQNMSKILKNHLLKFKDIDFSVQLKKIMAGINDDIL